MKNYIVLNDKSTRGILLASLILTKLKPCNNLECNKLIVATDPKGIMPKLPSSTQIYTVSNDTYRVDFNYKWSTDDKYYDKYKVDFSDGYCNYCGSTIPAPHIGRCFVCDSNIDYTPYDSLKSDLEELESNSEIMDLIANDKIEEAVKLVSETIIK